MPAFGLALGLAYARPSGSTEPSYVRTAFVYYSGGNSPVLNDPLHPYGYFDEAISDLNIAHPGEHVTIVLMANYAAVVGSSEYLTNALTGAGSLTIKSNDSGPWAIDEMNIGYVENADLRLDNVTITTLSWANSTSYTNPAAGSITGANSVTIATLNLPVEPFTNSPNPGNNGGTVTGSNGANGSDSVPDVSGPTNGSDGESVSANGTDGESRTGNSAWDITLFGSGLISQLNGNGTNASAGNGGNGGTATGGNGGNAGLALSSEYSENGANGGNGGNAVANGGHGGNAQGGNGSQVYKETGWTITNSDLSAGTATNSNGGSPGTATAGIGGLKSFGALGGNDGSDGSAGAAYANGGSPGSGTNGTAGAINNI